MLSHEEPHANTTMEMQSFSGKRRFARGSQLYDMTYYSFDEFLKFVTEIGFTKVDEEGLETNYAAALYMWNKSIDQEKEEVYIETLKMAIRKIPLASLNDFARDSCFLLELAHPGGLEIPGHIGFCLQLSDRGNVDFWGEASFESVIGIEVIKTCPHQVRLRAHTGGYLRIMDGYLDFGGLESDDEATIFELFPRDGDTPLVTIAPKGGAVLGTFIPRKPPQKLLAAGLCALHRPSPGMLELLDRAAQEATAKDLSLTGKRRHKQDAHMRYYSFKGFLLYVQKLYQLDVPAAVDMTRAMWKYACVGEEADDEDQMWNMVDGEGGQGDVADMEM